MRKFVPALILGVCCGMAVAEKPPVPTDSATQALILPFAVASDAAATPGASGDACPKTPGNDLDATNSQKLIDAVTTELQKQLAKKMETRTGQPGEEVAPGTLILAGCLTTVDPGNAVKRMAGMDLGASELAAHVVVQMKTADALVAVREFDATAKGAKKMPPLSMVGLATHAAAERKETLSADAKRLADEIVKTLSKPAAN
jgi:hypothetical protein